MGNIEKLNAKIAEIEELCNVLIGHIKENEIWDLNNEYPTEQYIANDNLQYRKLKDRIDSFHIIDEINSPDSVSALLNVQKLLHDKTEIYSKDLETVLFFMDKLSREADTWKESLEGEVTIKALPPKIFISHSFKDVEYVKCIVELLEGIGINESQLFCSSLTEYGIPLGEDIYDYLKTLFKNYSLQVIFILSNNYYQSPACLNEMGAAWILQNSYQAILLPDFKYRDITGAINANRISMKLDDKGVRGLLNQFKDGYIEKFDLTPISQTKWDRIRDDFIGKINAVSKK